MMLKWLKPKPPRPDTPVDYPDGLMVGTEDNEVYYIKSGKRYRLYSTRVFDSWSIPAVRGSVKSLADIPKASNVLGFRDGSLIRNFADGKLYLISASRRRHITNPDVLERLGLGDFDVINASEAETMLHREGEPIG